MMKRFLKFSGNSIEFAGKKRGEIGSKGGRDKVSDTEYSEIW